MYLCVIMLHAPGLVVFFGIFSVFGNIFAKVLIKQINIKQRKSEETQYSVARLRAGQVT